MDSQAAMLSSLPIHFPSWQLNTLDIPPHTQTVDIIVCVHNALADVQRCLESIKTYSTAPYHLILVDDGSATETHDYLADYAKGEMATLLRNEQARGYTCAANQGLHASQNPYSLLLNSDTIVSAHWLERLVACANSAPEIGLVGPLSNTASWQSIPAIESKGDWAENPLPTDMSVPQFANRVAALSNRLYPRIPFLNGFCLLIKRAVITQIGYFDEARFGQGYGEENDYCIRARQAGWQLAIADDVYIYHAQSKSYSHERRKQLAERAGIALTEKHGQTTIDTGVTICRHDKVIEGIRTRAKYLLERWNIVAQGQYHWRGKRVIFMLPVLEAGGGSNVVISEVRAMRRMGVDAVILNFLHHKTTFEKSYPQLDIPVIYTPTDFDLPRYCEGYDAVIATANYSIQWIAPLATQPNPPIIGYYIQDFEPYFPIEKAIRYRWFWRSAWIRRRLASYYFRRNADFRLAWLSYLQIPNCKLFTKTHWNKKELHYQLGKESQLVGASYNADLFVPRLNRTEKTDRLRISAMIRPSSSRRGALRTMQILQRIYQEFTNQIEIILFGVAEDNPAFQALPRDFAYQNLGLQTPEQLAILLAQIDIFVDFSNFQAMGLTAMEAMASGAAVIVPTIGGSDSFAVHQKNALMIDTSKTTDCYAALKQLITDNTLRNTLMKQAPQDIAKFYPEKSAYRILKVLFGEQ
ncbi:glycosyltransferase [Beggiatoa leptomitoformis]|uniref:Glycosyltransferase n=1 Tax=Beggiatoa leptomitoformis TaxID=288004 RepID=A0A2N9YG75_9GAMM|nr:glycosyltransferase [Beggiatoa leptomitoformis]AUI69528.1 glycosyltransferase [Beggiatoa leptomitoformis]QGX03705.1 glycosyltransferase [Beggiatoa leptomitoformis]